MVHPILGNHIDSNKLCLFIGLVLFALTLKINPKTVSINMIEDK